MKFTAKLWNELYADGQPVYYFPVLCEDGTPDTFQFKTLKTKTRSEAWHLKSGTPVVLIEGMAGGVALDHLVIRVDYGDK